MRKKRGFTLVELAIVLVVIGILLTMGVTLIATLTKRAKVKETKDIVKGAVESIISFAQTNYRLPADDSEFESVVRRPTDAFNKNLIYFVDEELTQFGNYVCRKRLTNITVRYCRNQACTDYTDTQNVAFLVVSGSLNYNVQTGDGNVYTVSHTVVIGSPTVIRVYAPDIPNVDDFPGDINRPEPYDDIVEWITLPELQTKAGCEYRIRIINNELPYAFENTPYTATIYAEGGVGNYEWCYEGNLPSGIDAECSGTLSPSSNCLNPDGTPNTSANWMQCDNLQITGTPQSGTAGTYNLRVYVKDSENNVAFRSFVLTVNPQTSSGGGGGTGSAPPGSDVSFANDLSRFQEYENQSSAVILDPSSGAVYFGNNLYGTQGCIWYPIAYQLRGKTMRAFFKFQFLTPDTSSDSRGQADGFTFTVRQSTWRIDCGTGGGGLGYDGLDGKSIAVEIDTYPNTWWLCDPSNNHVGIDMDGSVRHCSNPDYYAGPTPTWLEDGNEHNVRVEIHTNCNRSCSRCGRRRGSKALIKVWIDCSNCDDLTTDYTATPTVQKCFTWDSSLDYVRFGFTEGTGGRTQQVKIWYFGIRFD